ncbi:RNA dependent RNA polymerase-domain-containing protein [Mycena pura]|uniref:RNA-dependent RNA polymerase n=1 Tax=Mycena pura TaxID=153505 RepID=A0AAD6VM31_9AGAR|nr:RNA dependent RNA polymerase-domain-containing protein [Mycena pura]
MGEMSNHNSSTMYDSDEDLWSSFEDAEAAPDAFVAHPFQAGFRNASDQEIFAHVSLSTGVRWEIARLVSKHRGLTELSVDTLKELKGSSKDTAPKTAEIILREITAQVRDSGPIDAEHQLQSPWADLDLEESAMIDNPNAALGNCPEHLAGYGGTACFSGTLQAGNNKVSTARVLLDRCTLKASCRLWRRFGSSSFLKIRIPNLKTLRSGDEGINLRELFRKPFIIFESVFRSFFAKDGIVFLFKTCETFKNGVVQSNGGSGLTLFEFLDQFNPLQLNSDQAICKWASRFALGLSNSVPGPILDPACVEEINDIISAAQSNMTDGCGLSNVAFNRKLRHDFNLDSTPCAVQVRHGGRKGMLLMAPESHDSVPKIAFRKPSQVKIVYSAEAKAHPANSTVDILRFSHTRTPARISAEVMINLEHNGVPAELFVRMQGAYLAQGVDGLLSWAREPGQDTPECMRELYHAVEKGGGVYAERRLRETAVEARIRGLERFGETTLEEDDDDYGSLGEMLDNDLHQRSTAWWPDYVSGCPSSLAETAMVLLDAGFTPQSSPVLREKLKQIIRTNITYRAGNFNFDVLQSAGAFVVPDLMEVLGEDEIHFKSSRREFLNAGGVETDIIIGDVLVGFPQLPLKAVKHSQLSDVVDVIVCSVKGNRRLLDFLGGGDYDGDKAIVIWDSEIVDCFVNAPDKYSNEPEEIESCFTRDDTTVAKFLAEFVDAPPATKAAELQRYLLGSLRDPSVVGKYSSYHDNAVLTKGYDDHQSVKLAYQFCKILDSAKTGYLLKNETRIADQKTHGHSNGPAWKAQQKARGNYNSGNMMPFLERKVDPNKPSLSRPFIMDVLNAAARTQKDNWLCEVEQLFLPFEKSGQILDQELAQPWKTYTNFADQRKQEGDPKPAMDLSTIEAHVKEMYARHKIEIAGRAPDQSPRNGTSAAGFTNLPIEVRQDTLRALSRDFAAKPTPEQLQTIPDPTLIARLRASYAYLYDYEQNFRGWSRFPWNMALGELCQIKAIALGPHKMVTTTFYESFKLPGARR